jgi:hypothetical protein
MFRKRFRELWLPGIVTGMIFTGLGAYIGWKISHEDSLAQIRGLQDANKGLQTMNKGLQDQANLLQDQKIAILAQANQLAGILKTLAAQGHDLKLALDNHGSVTLGGHAILDSGGAAILTTESGNPIVTERGQSLLVAPAPAKRR